MRSGGDDGRSESVSKLGVDSGAGRNEGCSVAASKDGEVQQKEDV